VRYVALHAEYVIPGWQANPTNRNVIERCSSARVSNTTRLIATDPGCQLCPSGTSTNSTTGQTACGARNSLEATASTVHQYIMCLFA
jgi:hypothetical protein